MYWIQTNIVNFYDHTDSSNSQLLNEGWVPITFDELSGDYKDDFISYYNLNGGLEALLYHGIQAIVVLHFLNLMMYN